MSGLKLRLKAGSRVRVGDGVIEVTETRPGAVRVLLNFPADIRIERITEDVVVPIPRRPSLAQILDAASQGACAFVNESGDVVYRKFD